MTVVALVLSITGLCLVFGVRTWLHIRRTGRSGFNGISSPPGSVRWWAGLLFITALVLAVAAPALATAALVGAPSVVITDAAAIAGLVLVFGGLVGVLLAQSDMDASWRIGVAHSDRTELITDGLFVYVRNPVFTAMIITQVGSTLLVPNWLSALSLICLITAVELQVRLLEEPHLVAVHGADYLDYASRTGRFIPEVGYRVSAAAALSVTR